MSIGIFNSEAFSVGISEHFRGYHLGTQVHQPDTVTSRTLSLNNKCIDSHFSSISAQCMLKILTYNRIDPLFEVVSPGDERNPLILQESKTTDTGESPIHNHTFDI